MLCYVCWTDCCCWLQATTTMYAADAVNDVRVTQWTSSKRRRLMTTCFGGKSTIKQSLTRIDRQKASVEYRSSVDLLPGRLTAAAADVSEITSTSGRLTNVNSTSTYQCIYRQCSSVRQTSSESRMTSVSTCHADSAMTSRTQHTTWCQDSGYEGTSPSPPAPAPAPALTSTGSLACSSDLANCICDIWHILACIVMHCVDVTIVW